MVLTTLSGVPLGDPDAEVVHRRGHVGQPLRGRRDLAEAFEHDRLVGQHGERDQALALDHLAHLDEQLGHRLRLAGDRCQHRRIAAVVGDVLVLDLAGGLDQLHEVVAGGGQAGRGDRHIGAVLLQRVEQLAEILERRIRIGGDRRQVGDREEQVPVLDAGIEQPEHAIGADVGGGAGCPGVAVLRRFDRVLGADRARRARLIDDDEFLLELGFQLAGDDARHLVGRAARGPRHDDVDRPVRLPAVVLRNRRGGEQSNGTADQRQEQSPHFHVLPRDSLAKPVPGY